MATVNDTEVTLLGVALAGAVSMTAGEGDWAITSTLVGLTLLFFLVAYDPHLVGFSRKGPKIRTIRVAPQAMAFNVERKVLIVDAQKQPVYCTKSQMWTAFIWLGSVIIAVLIHKSDEKTRNRKSR